MTHHAHPLRRISNQIIVLTVALAAAAPSEALADPLGAGSGTLYALAPSSTVQEGCLPPCLCPILVSEGVRGTFTLVYIGNIAGVETYAVRDVNWTASINGVRVDVAGEGVYRLGSPNPITVLEQSLELDLLIGNDPVQHFESGWVSLGNLNGIKIAVAMNGFFCYDRVFDIAAVRARKDRMVTYTIADGATFQQGCFDPCDCPLELPRPLVGTFTLLPMGDAVPTTEFAVVDVRWQALAATVTEAIPIHGHGFYRLGNTLAPEQQLSLSLVVGNRPRQRFDSGVVPGGAGFPHIDSTVSINGMICDDVVMHVIADPDAALCGGIAGLPCNPGEFCKLPPGNCCCDHFGMCTPVPGACIDIWDPVCGCDGVTYGNECSADAAGVSVDHRGECELSSCCLPDGTCMDVGPQRCLINGGEPVPGVLCATVTCTPAATGACCLSDPTGVAFCTEVSARRCAFEGGAYAGDGTTCSADPNAACPVALGACCLPDGNCLDNLPIDLCIGTGGLPLPGVTCDPMLCAPPATGACCLSGPAGAPFCLELTVDRCLAEGGSYAGDGTLCQLGTTAPCPAPEGACCLPDGSCQDIPSDLCLGAGGEPLPGVPCATVFCTADPVGACCLNSAVGSLGCFVGTALECQARVGIYQGDNTLCPADPSGPCPEPTGACCLANLPGTPLGGCAVASAARCLQDGGTYLGDNTICPADNTLPCGPATGACCLTDAAGAQSCLDGLSAERCRFEGGTYSGDGTTCPTDPTAAACPTPCDIACPTGGGCFRGCGEVIQTNACVIFRADSGEEFGFTNLGPFPITGRVFLSGCVDPLCADVCAGANGCLHIFDVRPCEQVCGGFAGIPCTSPNEFCKFPDATCSIADNQGLCKPLPGVCPRIYAPVCGCDGITYGNECESDAAGVSIDHRGECVGNTCPAARVLTNPDLSYCPSSPKLVEIVLSIPMGTSAIALEDAPPVGWTVSQISDGGVLDAANGKVKWGPLFAPFPASVSYVVTPLADVGQACFLGTLSLDGVNQIVCGDRCVDVCCPHIAADLPRPPCAACNTNGCQTCDSVCEDGEVSLCELGSYACEWITGCHDDLAGMTRSAFLWRNGECYCYDSQSQNWRSSACSTSTSVCCADILPPPGPAAAVSGNPGRSTIKLVRSALSVKRTRSKVRQLEVAIVAPVGTMAVGVEVDVPSGWEILSISDGGTWDTTYHKIKWGPWMDTLSRTVTFQAKPTEVMEGRVRRVQSIGKAASFTGTVSFDGVNQAMDIARR